MRLSPRRLGTGLLLIAAIWVRSAGHVFAQSLMTSRSLGGYGSSAPGSAGGMSANGPIIPYAGSFGGFMPYGMGGGAGGLSFSTRSTYGIASGRTTFLLSRSSDGISMSRGGMAQGAGVRSSATGSFGLSGTLELGSQMKQSMTGAGSNVMPPSFGYPFYQPPSWMSALSSAGSMSPM